MSPGLALDGAIVLLAALGLAHVLRAEAPSLGRDLLGGGLGVTLVLPLLAMLPAIPLPTLVPAPPVGTAATLTGLTGLTLQEPAGLVGAVVGSVGGLWDGGRWVGVAAGWLWALGAGVAFTRLGVGHVRAWRLRASAVTPSSDWLTAAACVGPPVPVRAHGALDAPVLVGILRPVILVPSGGWGTAAGRRRALRHEAAHARSHDNLRLLVGEAARAVRWFDPIAWFALRQMRFAAEQAADAAVVRAGEDAAAYADDLVQLARVRLAGPRLAAATSFGGPPIARRVRGLLHGVPASAPRGLRLGAGLCLAALAVGLALPWAARPLPAAAAGVAPELEAQAVVDAELARLVETWTPEAAAIVVVDARSGAVVAVGEHGDGAADRRWASGSVVKPFVAVAAVDAGVAPEWEILGHALEVSSNARFVALASAVGPATLAPALRAQGLSAASGTRPADLALGQFPTTTRELAQAYAGLGETLSGRTVRSLLTGVVDGADGTGRAAAVPGVPVAGKTGTARLGASADPEGPVLASFVGLVPADDPRWSVAVQVADPRPGGWGGKVAAPAFSRVAQGLR